MSVPYSLDILPVKGSLASTNPHHNGTRSSVEYISFESSFIMIDKTQCLTVKGIAFGSEPPKDRRIYSSIKTQVCQLIHLHSLIGADAGSTRHYCFSIKWTPGCAGEPCAFSLDFLFIHSSYSLFRLPLFKVELCFRLFR